MSRGASRGARGVAATLIALLVAAPFVLAGLGGAPFDDPGEGMHVEIARELIRSRDALALTLNGVRYVDKPPMLYALLALAIETGGASELSARLVPALGALAAVAATAWLGARLLTTGAGVAAGLGLLTSVLFYAFARYVRPETIFVAAITWGLALTLIGLTERRRVLIGLGFVAFGLAGWAKDPLGAIAPPLAILVAWVLAGGARREWPGVPWAAVAVWALLGFGWWAIVEMRTSGTLWYTFVDNKVLNATGARRFPDEDVPLTSLEFIGVAVLGAAPWSLTALASVTRLVRGRRWREASELPWTALTVWTVGVFALTLVSRFRLPHYGIPTYGAIALLGIRAWWTAGARTLVALHALGSLGGGVAAWALWRSDGRAFIDAVATTTDVGTRKTGAIGGPAPFPPWPSIRPLVGHVAVVFLVGALLLVVVLVVPARWRSVGGVAVAVAVMLAVLPAAATALSVVSSHRAVRDLASFVGNAAAPDDVVAHEGPIEASGALEWYSGRRPVIVDGRRSVLAFGAARADAASVVWDVAELRRTWTGGRRVWLVSMRPPDRSIAPSLPGACLALATPTRWLYTNRVTPGLACR